MFALATIRTSAHPKQILPTAKSIASETKLKGHVTN
jgi:hypothetical protein